VTFISVEDPLKFCFGTTVHLKRLHGCPHLLINNTSVMFRNLAHPAITT